jgi:SAM-dependent methyltransferase
MENIDVFNVEELSKYYDKIHSNEKYFVNRNDDALKLEHLASMIPSESKVLDAGCGFGLPVLKFFCDRNFRVYGTDISRKSLEISAKFAPCAFLYRQDTAELNFNRNFFELVTCFYSISHMSVDRQYQALNKIYDVLIPGGYLSIDFATKEYTGHEEFSGIRNFDDHILPCHHTTPEKYIEIFKEIGYDIIKAEIETTSLTEIDAQGNVKHVKLFSVLARKKLPKYAIKFSMVSTIEKFKDLKDFFQYEESLLKESYSSKNWEQDLSIAVERNLIINRLYEIWDSSKQEYLYFLFSETEEYSKKFIEYVDNETNLIVSIVKAEGAGFITNKSIIPCTEEIFNNSIVLLLKYYEQK